MKRIAPLFIITAGLMWGCMGLFVRFMEGQGLSSMDMVAMRAIITTVLMFLFILIYNRKLFKIKLKDIWIFLGIGICSIVFFNYCYFKAIMITSLSVAAILLYTSPAFVIVLSFILFREKITKYKIIALIMTFTGCVLVTGVLTDMGSLTPQGILIGLGAGFGYALYSIFSRFAIKRGYETFTIIFYTFLIASVATFFMAEVGAMTDVATKSVGMFWFCILFAVVSTVIPYLTYTIGLNYIENSKASIIVSIEPVVATLIGVFVYRETLSVTGVIGIVLVFGALVLCTKQE